MPSEIPKYFDRIGEIVSSSENHILDDYEYAFCAGQLIYYLLYQSQSGGKTHSPIEPFINRTTVEAFNDQLVRIFNQYKHSIDFGNKIFNRLFEEVIGYRPQTGYKDDDTSDSCRIFWR
jgi:CRISPR-associated protein Csh1